MSSRKRACPQGGDESALKRYKQAFERLVRDDVHLATCPVCKDIAKGDIRIFECNHMVCIDCSVQLGASPSCPVCRGGTFRANQYDPARSAAIDSVRRHYCADCEWIGPDKQGHPCVPCPAFVLCQGRGLAHQDTCEFDKAVRLLRASGCLVTLPTDNDDDDSDIVNTTWHP
jgi:hypothetical protein